MVQATADGILLKPVTAALIKHGRGILTRKPCGKPLADEWAEHNKQADIDADFKARLKISLADAFAAALAKEKKAELVMGLSYGIGGPIFVPAWTE